jgi:hypothetical protein
MSPRLRKAAFYQLLVQTTARILMNMRSRMVTDGQLADGVAH